jgi:hypothetical protein
MLFIVVFMPKTVVDIPDDVVEVAYNYIMEELGSPTINFKLLCAYWKKMLSSRPRWMHMFVEPMLRPEIGIQLICNKNLLQPICAYAYAGYGSSDTSNRGVDLCDKWRTLIYSIINLFSDKIALSSLSQEAHIDMLNLALVILFHEYSVQTHDIKFIKVHN